jgi:hypothetical protein
MALVYKYETNQRENLTVPVQEEKSFVWKGRMEICNRGKVLCILENMPHSMGKVIVNNNPGYYIYFTPNEGQPKGDCACCNFYKNS